MAIIRSGNRPHSYFMDEVVELGLEEAVVLQIIRDIVYNEAVENVTESRVLEVIPYLNCTKAVLEHLCNSGKLIQDIR